MTSLAQSLPAADGRLDWLWRWLRDELKPYPGRVFLVGRMVAAATLVTIICMTFRIPFAFQGAIYVLLISRESSRATLHSAATILLVTGIGAAYLLVSVSLFINEPSLHFLWVIASLFLAFYAISVLTNYITAVVFAVMISTGVPLWDRHVSAENNVEDTLWLCLAILVGILVTAGVELAFVRLLPGDEVVLPIAERLSAVENVLTCYAEGRGADPATQEKVIRLGILGTSLLRRSLRRSDHSLPYSVMAGAVIVLVGRLVDLAAALTQLGLEPSEGDQKRLRRLAAAVASIRNALTNRQIPAPISFDTGEESPSVIALLGEMEDTVKLIPPALTGYQSIHEQLPSTDDIPRARLFAPDAFVNSAHLQFALKGCLAAGSCYVIYNAIDWPGISTAVTTCLLTALTTIGASRQKQVLRVTGAIVGGFLIGMGSQVFILPYIDSIVGFAVLVAIVTALSSWFMTSSPRLSYFGVQVALAFYLINLQEFTIQTSLAVARDRVVGILLGLFVMWLVFDQLWGARAGVEMRKTFIANLRLLAQLAREPLSENMRIALARVYSLRETVDKHFGTVRALADGVLFEFGPTRQQDLASRDQIRRWQPQLWTFFAIRNTLIKYRLRLPGFELPMTVLQAQQEFDGQLARMLDSMADRLEGKVSNAKDDFELSFKRLGDAVQAWYTEAPQSPMAARLQTFLPLSRTVESLIVGLDAELA